MREMISILEVYDIGVDMTQTEKLGCIVYEDSHQIAAETFKDTGLDNHDVYTEHQQRQCYGPYKACQRINEKVFATGKPRHAN